jgi:hypothetical protein
MKFCAHKEQKTLFAKSLYFLMHSSLVCLMKKEYILYDNIDNIEEITEEKNMKCNLTNFRKIIYWRVLYLQLWLAFVTANSYSNLWTFSITALKIL